MSDVGKRSHHPKHGDGHGCLFAASKVFMASVMVASLATMITRSIPQWRIKSKG